MKPFITERKASMSERQQTISRGEVGHKPAPHEESIERLSRRIAEIHEHLGRAHQARAEFERAGGQYAPSFGSPSADPWYPPGDLRENLGPPPRPDGFTVGLCEAYEDRGRARLAREEYHLALADFAAALLLHPAASFHDMTGDLWAGRTEAWDNLCGSFPSPEDSADGSPPEAPAPSWMARWIPAGHLIVGDNAILAHYPATPEGQRAAVRHADRLVGDAEARSFLENRYLVNRDEFDVLVYSFDGARLRLEHLAPFIDDDPESSPNESS